MSSRHSGQNIPMNLNDELRMPPPTAPLLPLTFFTPQPQQPQQPLKKKVAQSSGVTIKTLKVIKPRKNLFRTIEQEQEKKKKKEKIIFKSKAVKLQKTRTTEPKLKRKKVEKKKLGGEESSKIISDFVNRVKLQSRKQPTAAAVTAQTIIQDQLPTVLINKPRVHLINPKKTDKAGDRRPQRSLSRGRTSDLRSPLLPDKSPAPETTSEEEAPLSPVKQELMKLIDTQGLQIAEKHLLARMQIQSGITKRYETVLKNFSQLQVPESEKSHAEIVQNRLQRIVKLHLRAMDRLSNCCELIKTVAEHKPELVNIVKSTKFPERLLRNKVEVFKESNGVATAPSPPDNFNLFKPVRAQPPARPQACTEVTGESPKSDTTTDLDSDTEMEGTYINVCT